MKKIVFLALVISSLVVIFAPGAAQAAGGPAVSSSSVVMNFPASITFKIAASSDTNLVDIRLHYLVNRMEHARVVSEVYLDFTPSPAVTTQWLWDMRKTGGLPPGSS